MLFCNIEGENEIFSKYYHYIIFNSQLGFSTSIFNVLALLGIKDVKLIDFEKISSVPEEDCSICLEEFKKFDCIKTKCGHIYHNKCIEVSLITSKKCPLCRHEFQV